MISESEGITLIPQAANNLGDIYSVQLESRAEKSQPKGGLPK